MSKKMLSLHVNQILVTMKQRKPYEIREFICPPITAAELTEDNPVWQTVQQTARRLLEKYGEAKGVSPDRFDAEQDVLTVEAHYLCVRIHAAIINGANLTLANHCDALGYEYVPYYKYPDIEWVVALAYMAFKMSDRYTFYEHLFTDWLNPPDAACGIALSELAKSACPPVSFDKLKLEPHPTPSDKLPSSLNFWYIALNKGLSSEEENRKAILALYPEGDDRKAVEALMNNVFTPNYWLLDGLRALKAAGLLNKTRDYAKVLRLLREGKLSGKNPSKSSRAFIDILNELEWEGTPNKADTLGKYIDAQNRLTFSFSEEEEKEYIAKFNAGTSE